MSLPLIYRTDLPERLRNALSQETHQTILLQAPTGFGKTFMLNHLLAEYCQQSAQRQTVVECITLMPFRVAVKAMHHYLHARFGQELSFGYAMKDDRATHRQNHCILKTVGYWLEEMFQEADVTTTQTTTKNATKTVVVVDEAHDASWQTDLALRVLCWLRRNGRDITIIIASATLDVEAFRTYRLENATEPAKEIQRCAPVAQQVQSTKETQTAILHLAVKEVADVAYHYLSAPLGEAVRNGRFSPTMKDNLLKTVAEAIREIATSGDLLVLLPGFDDISYFHDQLSRHPDYAGWLLCPLYSQLTREEIQYAIAPQSGHRKIILATNIVENAITIRQLAAVVDSGYRKTLHVDENGIQQLVLSPASQANLRQAAGRVGREGRRGHAYLLLTEEEFAARPAFGERETERNPYYQQIMKLIARAMPLNEILPIEQREKIATNIAFLESHGLLHRVATTTAPNGYQVTSIGAAIAALPCSIRAGHFLVEVFRTLPPETYYVACVIAAWIDYSHTLFYRCPKKPGEDPAGYRLRLNQLKEQQSRFQTGDCLTTMLNTWCLSWLETTEQTLRDWCLANGLFEKAFSDIQLNVNHLVKAATLSNITIPIPQQKTQWQEIHHALAATATRYHPAIKVAFHDWIFQKRQDNHYHNATLSERDRFTVDRFIQNGTPVTPHSVVAFSLRRIQPRLVVLSKIVDIETAEERAARLQSHRQAMASSSGSNFSEESDDSSSFSSHEL